MQGEKEISDNYDIGEVKYPKFPISQNQSIQNQSKNTENNTGSKVKVVDQKQFIRFFMALVVTVLLYNFSQQTTISYNEIIQNQKMFVAKDIRGILPILGGDIEDLLEQKQWSVVYYENYHYNDSELLNNLTFTWTNDEQFQSISQVSTNKKFEKQTVSIRNQYCKYKIDASWKAYSYNLDLKILKTETLQKQSTLLLNYEVNDHTENARGNEAESQAFHEKTRKCEKQKQLVEDLLNNVSLFTIFETQLYILVEQPYMIEDYFLILESSKNLKFKQSKVHKKLFHK